MPAATRRRPGAQQLRFDVDPLTVPTEYVVWADVNWFRRNQKIRVHVGLEAPTGASIVTVATVTRSNDPALVGPARWVVSWAVIPAELDPPAQQPVSPRWLAYLITGCPGVPVSLLDDFHEGRETYRVLLGGQASVTGVVADTQWFADRLERLAGNAKMFIDAGLVLRPTRTQVYSGDAWMGVNHAFHALVDVVHPVFWSGGVGWFAPGVDPEAFGSLFIALDPVEQGLRGNTDRRIADTVDPEWVVFQTGIRAPYVTARIDNPDAVRGLVSHVLSGSPDTVLVLRSLSFPDIVRAATRDDNARAAVLAARAAFTASSRDVLPVRALQSAMAGVLCTTHKHSLVTVAAFGPQSHVLPGPKPVHAAWRLFVLKGIPFDDFVQQITSVVTPVGVRVVVVEPPAGLPELWITMNPELFVAHAAAFQLDSRSRFAVYTAAS